MKRKENRIEDELVGYFDNPTKFYLPIFPTTLLCWQDAQKKKKDWLNKDMVKYICSFNKPRVY